MRLSRHAQVRIQQRGIPANFVEILHDFGRHQHDRRNGIILSFDHRARKRLRRMFGSQEYRRLEPYLDTYAVMALNGEIITVGHRHKRVFWS